MCAASKISAGLPSSVENQRSSSPSRGGVVFLTLLSDDRRGLNGR
jgi:hypothetical protein